MKTLWEDSELLVEILKSDIEPTPDDIRHITSNRRKVKVPIEEVYAGTVDFITGKLYISPTKQKIENIPDDLEIIIINDEVK